MFSEEGHNTYIGILRREFKFFMFEGFGKGIEQHKRFTQGPHVKLDIAYLELLIEQSQLNLLKVR